MRKLFVIRSPNKAEKKLDGTLQELFPGVFKFSGSGDMDLPFGKKIPDWISFKQKKIIELFGERWHVPSDSIEKKRFYSSLGYRTLIVWCRELDNKKKLIRKISRFVSK